MTTTTKIVLIVVVLVILLGVLFALPRFTAPDQFSNPWKELGIDCLEGHQNVAYHIHPNLEIYVAGQPQSISANIGVTNNCMAEIHTHDSTGKLHVEAVTAGKEFTLQKFFDIWGEKLNREGYQMRATVDNQEIKDPANLILKDGQQFRLDYTLDRTTKSS